eukprot:5994983-Lingulodinium_polyedra.AAC.1
MRGDALHEELDHEMQYVCGHQGPEGLCTFAFATKQALCMHQLAAHGVRDVARALTVCNQCMFCKAVLRTRFIAQNHVVRSVQRGHCYTGWERG